MVRLGRWVVLTASTWPYRPGRWGRGHGVGVGGWCRTRVARWCLAPCRVPVCARGTGRHRVGMARCTLALGMDAWRGPCLPPPACSSRWPPRLRCRGGGHPVRSPWGSRRTGRVGLVHPAGLEPARPWATPFGGVVYPGSTTDACSPCLLVKGADCAGVCLAVLAWLCPGLLRTSPGRGARN